MTHLQITSFVRSFLSSHHHSHTLHRCQPQPSCLYLSCPLSPCAISLATLPPLSHCLPCRITLPSLLCCVPFLVLVVPPLLSPYLPCRVTVLVASCHLPCHLTSHVTLPSSLCCVVSPPLSRCVMSPPSLLLSCCLLSRPITALPHRTAEPLSLCCLFPCCFSHCVAPHLSCCVVSPTWLCPRSLMWPLQHCKLHSLVSASCSSGHKSFLTSAFILSVLDACPPPLSMLQALSHECVMEPVASPAHLFDT